MPTSELVDYSDYDQEIQYTPPELPKPELVRIITREEYIREQEDKKRQKDAIQKMIDTKLRIKRSSGSKLSVDKMRSKIKSLKSKKIPKPPGASSSLSQGYHEIFQKNPVPAPAPFFGNGAPFVPLSNIFNNYYGPQSYQNTMNSSSNDSANPFAPPQNADLYKNMFSNISKILNEKQD